MSKEKRSKLWKATGLVIISLGLMLPGVSLAQDRQRESVRRYDFDEDLVTAGLDRGTGTIVQVTRKAKSSSLIVVRENFIPELLKSAEDI